MEGRIQAILARILSSILEEMGILPGSRRTTGGRTTSASSRNIGDARGRAVAQRRKGLGRTSREMPPRPPQAATTSRAAGTTGPLEQLWNVVVFKVVKKKAAKKATTGRSNTAEANRGSSSTSAVPSSLGRKKRVNPPPSQKESRKNLSGKKQRLPEKTRMAKVKSPTTAHNGANTLKTRYWTQN